MEDYIKIYKLPMLGREIGNHLEPNKEYYLYKFLDTKTNVYCALTADKKQVDDDKEFEQMIYARAKYKLKNYKAGNESKSNNSSVRPMDKRRLERRI